ncbi:STAS/SEC14 domain-containing protein [Solimonas terrae]|uniref:STAS/SEC14 domain-containing protein n=1 Tax=Solimonas terrae TaxID=1396819 RepID=A0A6M2BM29_9GAMM|nr:STAS/SEC14 domain-containing protein [Solimonas terrae]NGY03666.1 STAS/SEC14 domain-containing protein [Solimonas terrae]
MIESIPFPAGNVVGLRVDGRIGTEAYDAVRKTIDAKLATHDKLRIYVEVPAFDGMSAEAFFKDLKFGLKNWDRFEREAVVSDQSWVQNVLSVAAKLMPGVEVRSFAMAETEAAKEWICH